MVIKLKNGEVHYINKLDDFKEVVEPELYNAVEEFVENSISEHDGSIEIDNLTIELANTEDIINQMDDQLDSLYGDLESAEEDRDKYHDSLDSVYKDLEDVVDMVLDRKVANVDIIDKLQSIRNKIYEIL
jgi:hypothetical protein